MRLSKVSKRFPSGAQSPSGDSVRSGLYIVFSSLSLYLLVYARLVLFYNSILCNDFNAQGAVPVPGRVLDGGGIKLMLFPTCSSAIDNID
jgi:hypothetical protein